MSSKPKTIDDYLAVVPPAERAILEQWRQAIHRIVPDVEECISYSIPAFRLGRHTVAGFAATKRGCSYYPFSGSTLGTLANELRELGRTKSAVHFDIDRPLSTSLLRKLITTRIAECTKEDLHENRTNSRSPRRRSKTLPAGAERSGGKADPDRKVRRRGA